MSSGSCRLGSSSRSKLPLPRPLTNGRLTIDDLLMIGDSGLRHSIVDCSTGTLVIWRMTIGDWRIDWQFSRTIASADARVRTVLSARNARSQALGSGLPSTPNHQSSFVK
jgi:hypothetical protein